MVETPPEGSPRTRRPRYPGRNPRRFAEKYKERDPERFPGVDAHVRASGKTPAGSHVPVLLEEVLDSLSLRPGQLVVDATLGYGGHAEAILALLSPGGRLVGLDVDPLELPRTEARLRLLGFGEDVFTARRMSFAGLPALFPFGDRPGADAVLADLGVSSMQLDDEARGFTYKREGPLDLRMNPQRGRPAAHHLGKLSEAALAALLLENDEPYAEEIAREVAAARAVSPIETTSALAGAVRRSLAPLPARTRLELGDTPVARTFQALRLLVNEELGALAALLAALPGCLTPGGRVAVISFHSGEDRLVKKSFQRGLASGVYSAVSDGVIRASAVEQRANPRSRPAKLRWAVRA